MSHLPPVRLVLASASPRRRDLFSQLGLEFSVRPVDVDESPRAGEDPRQLVERLARTKAIADSRPGELLVAADTVVVLDGELLGKPSGPQEARQMLRALSGRTHSVWSGVAVFSPGEERLVAGSDVSSVTLAELSEEAIGWYVETGEPLDKAGSYAIQGLGALFVERIEGNYSTVVGLPLPLLGRLLEEMDRSVDEFRAELRPADARFA